MTDKNMAEKAKAYADVSHDEQVTEAMAHEHARAFNLAEAAGRKVKDLEAQLAQKGSRCGLCQRLDQMDGRIGWLEGRQEGA